MEQAVIHYAAGEVRWEVGERVATFRGGHNAITGEQSIIHISSIVGTKGVPPTAAAISMKKNSPASTSCLTPWAASITG
jgi:hypothetical protein